MAIDIKQHFSQETQAWYKCRACGRTFPSGTISSFRELMDAMSDLSLANDERKITLHREHVCDDGCIGMGDLIAVKPLGVKAAWQG